MSNSGEAMLQLYKSCTRTVDFGGIEVALSNMHDVVIEGHVLKFYYPAARTNWIIDFDNLPYITGK